MKLNWVTLSVSDLEKSIEFYTKCLNLEIAERFGTEHHQIVMLGKTDHPKLELIWEPNTRIEHPGNGISIGLEADDIDQLVLLLRENGIEAVGPISPNPHIRFFFVNDPDGYRVQLIGQA